ncbi:DUF5979 domain-containing protein [Luteimicrobium sp. DT211]|uniref:DUF5979 domain-containing protein n=1 Tax=Luteimicrobium sp. DT211 TaxID=3393412 RepID=UPI003CF7A270
MTKTRTLIASVLAFALALPLTVAGIVLAPAADAVGGTLEVTKSVDSPGPYGPGDTMTFTMQVTCQSDPCAAAELTDTLPAPLVLDGDDAIQVTTAGGGTYSTAGSDGDGGTHVVVDATQVQEDGNPGMAPGTTATVSVQARVPDDATADYNGTVTNTANVTQDGGNSDSDTADVTIDVPTTIATTVTKDASTSSVPAVAGQPVSFTIHATNTSNEAVDSLVVSDPSDGGADPFEYLAVTGISSFTPPDGADHVSVEWTDAGGATHQGYDGAIPSDPNDLLTGIDPLSDVHGLSFTFTGADGIPIDDDATIVLATETRDNVADIPDGETETVTNTAQSDVTSPDGDDSATDDAAVDIVSEPPTVTTSKSFDDDHLLAGESTTATVRSVVGDRPVSTMVISDPTDGQDDLADQGLTFGGFGSDAAWPAGADHVSIEYTFADGSTQTVESDTRDAFPPPTAQGNDQVTGFTITFTSDDPNGIEPGDFANVPFDVTAQAVPGEDDVTTTNTTTTDVTAADGSTGTDDASDDITRQPARIDTNVDKIFTPDEILGVPGARTVVELPAEVCGQTQVDAGTCDATSTVPSDDLIVSDPANPGATPTEFWDHMNLTSIGPMDIPAGSTLQVNYWNGSAWVPLAGPITSDQSPWTYQVGSDPSPDDIQGIQFDFEPTDPDAGLPPGFKVEPYMSFTHRGTLRSDPSTSALPTGTDPVTYTNDVESQVDNPDADTSPVTDDDSADITVDPTDGSGPGDSVDKGWVDPDTGDVLDSGVLVPALTDDERTARVSWGTGGYPMSQVQLADVPSPATGDAVADTVYDAFDLVRIAPITTTTDPLIAFDQVSKVELFSSATGGWVDITAAACANGCDGTFGGYTLSAAEQDTTLSVRLTFVESPTRASRITSPNDPPVGSGVAGSVGNDRPVDLVFRIRQDMRVSGDPVLGNDPDNGQQTYNTGTDGLVSNTVGMDSWALDTPTTDPADYHDTDSAVITITDRPVNVTTTKQFEEDTLGLPPEGTAAGDYPKDTLTLTADNTTNAKVRTMTIQDPAPAPANDSNTFDLMNLTGFRTIDAPTGADASKTEVFLTRGGTEDPAITADAALALTAGDLADVTGVRVVFHGLMVTTTDDTTPARVVLDMQLRADHRGDGTPITEGDAVDNYSFASATNPEATATDTANDTVNIVAPTYGVDATKNIDPASRYEGSDNDYTVTLTGKPTGTVRTKKLTITDDDPRFWNAFDFNGFAATNNATPIARVTVDALVGVDYALDNGTLVQTCNGDTDLTACWELGTPSDANSPALPAGVTNGQVQGLRYTFDGGADLPNWEHPSNPTATGAFKATQREFLRYGVDGATDTPVPSDLSTNEIAPGETKLGYTTNTQQVHADGSWNNGQQAWTADDDATDDTLLQHLTNQVTITKTPGDGDQPRDENPNSPIPYAFVVTNNGQWPQTGVTIVDSLPTDGGEPSLVPTSGEIPDNGTCATQDDFTVQLRNADGTTPIEGASAQYCMDADGAPTIAVTLPDDFVLQPGEAIVVDTPLEYRGGTDPVDPGTNVTNSVTVSDDRIYDTCDSTHNASIDNPQTTEVTDCTADTTTQPVALTPLRITKAVKGVGAGDPAVSEGDPNYDDLGVLDVNANDENASGCQEPSVPDYEENVIYYGEHCVPITRPGGVERWQVRLVNAGNIPAHIVAGIDVLPVPGDVGVVVPTDRGSEWRPRLIGNFTYDGQPVTDTTPMKLFYTTDTLDEACNEADILNETTPGGVDWSDPDYSGCQSDVEGRTWQEVTSTTPESQLTQATALKAVLTYDDANEGLGPGDDLALTFDTRTPANAPQTTAGQEPIAWNKVAEGAQGVYVDPDTGDVTHPVSLVTEPPKVGVAMATGSLKLTKDVVTPPGTDFPLPDTYPVKLVCTSVGAFDEPVPVPVQILDTNGADKSVVDVPANGTITVNDRSDPGTTAWSNVTIPWGATCYVQEQPTSQGSTVTYQPTSPILPARSGPITALRDYSNRTDIAHPISTDPDVINGATVTNTYEEGGFTVSKAVDTGGAVDQDGNPIAYTRDYTFTASCTFNDTEVVPDADQTFTLNDGESKTVDGLPAGSECTVTETDTGGAASTTTTTTTADATGEPTDGTSSTFTITPDADDQVTNTVDVENTYTVGSVELTKAVDGDGADDWGQGPFTVHLTCTLDGADPTTVYDADHTLTPPDDLTWTVENLPTGASCTVTEPNDGGANDTTIDNATFTVGDDDTDDPSVVTVANTFTEGAIQVTKRIAGLDPDSTEYQEALDATYTFSLACTREVDGVQQEVPIPGDNPIQVTPSEDPVGTWDGLPTGATCQVTEQFPGGEEQPPVVLIVPRTVTVGDGTTVGVAATNVFRAAPLTVDKVVTGDAADQAPDSFPVTIECFYGEGDNRVALPVDPDDPQANPGPFQTDITPGTPFTTADLPIGSECTVTEDDNGGATSTTVTNDGQATIVLPGDDPDANTLVVTNTYDDTGFTVSKTVDDGGAKDSGGDAVDYTGSYGFTATCEFNGTEQLADADQSFTLKDGETHTVTGVPVNSVCQVEETDVQGAPSTTMVITQTGDARDATTGTSSGTFVLDEGGADVNTVAVTNHYTVGSVKVTKELAGDGADAWGSGPFTVRLVCTLDGTDPSPVYDATHELKPGDLTWTVGDLPTGAHCDVTEPGAGGATSSTVSPADGVTVPGPDDSPATATFTVTNTFDVGSIVVHKALDGDGAADHRSDTFTVSLACTRDVDGTLTDVMVPGGAIRTVSATKDATYAGLPANATCTLTETDDGGADSARIDPGTVTVPVGSSVAITVTNTFGATPPPPSPSPSSTATQAGTGGLAITGADFLHLGLIAAGVLALGLLVFFAALWTRRRE